MRKMERFFCDKPWDNIFINVRGDCYPCCFIHETDGKLGNASSGDLEEIFTGPAARRLREEIAAGKLPFPCRGCAVFGNKKGLIDSLRIAIGSLKKFMA